MKGTFLEDFRGSAVKESSVCLEKLMRFSLECTYSHLDRGNSFFVNLGVVLALGTKVLYIRRARWFQPEEKALE